MPRQSNCLNSSGGLALSGSMQVYAPSSPSPLLFIMEIMAEGVSRSVIAKQDQTIRRENSPLILLKLSTVPRRAYKNIGVVLCGFSAEQKCV